MFRCPHCGGANQPAASFCINCGEPLDEESLAEFALPGAGKVGRENALGKTKREREAREGSSSLFRGRKLELWLGFALVVGVTGFVLWSYVNQEAAASHYRAGQDAYGRGEYRAALSEFTQADGYLESNRRVDDANHQLDKLAGFYKEVQRAASEGRWWEVAHTIVSEKALEQNYSDIPALLAKARSINGKIVYTLSSMGKSTRGLYVAEADGGNALYITGTTSLSEARAISPDNRWLVYMNMGERDVYHPLGSAYKIYLLNLHSSRAAEILLPDGPNIYTWARFLDNTTFLIGGDVNISTFTVSDLTSSSLTPTSTETTDAYERREYKALLLSTDAQGNTTLSAAEYDGANPRTVAVEQGNIDSALISKDSHFVVYRVCVAAGTRGALNCTLKFVDLKSPGSQARQIATIPIRRKNDPNNSILGEFTEDGKHLLVLEQFDRMYEAHLLNLETEKWVKLPDAILDTGTEGEIISPLLPDYSPGLRFWQGPNSLAHTSSAIEVETTPAGYGKHSPVYQTMSHLLSISPDGNYAVYFTPRNSRNRMTYDVRLAQLAPHGSENRTDRPAVVIGSVSHSDILEQPSNIANFLPDGSTVLITSANRRGFRSGIDVYRLDTGAYIGEIAGPDNTRPNLIMDNRP